MVNAQTTVSPGDALRPGVDPLIHFVSVKDERSGAKGVNGVGDAN